MKGSNINNCVLYCRVSSKEQEETGYSLPSQEKLLKEYAERRNNFTVVKVFSVAESAGTLPLWTKVRRQISASVEASPGVTIPNAILSLTDGLLIRRFYCGKDEYQCISPGKDSTTHLKKFLSIYFSHLARWSSQRVSFQSYFLKSLKTILLLAIC